MTDKVFSALRKIASEKIKPMTPPPGGWSGPEKVNPPAKIKPMTPPPGGWSGPEKVNPPVNKEKRPATRKPRVHITPSGERVIDMGPNYRPDPFEPGKAQSYP